jgi:hypothetical protein
MAEKRERPESLEELARRENEAARAREELRQELLQSGEKLVKDVPARFFKLAEDLREAVTRFNTAADPERRLTWRESAALAARDDKLTGDYNLAFGRGSVEVVVALNQLYRSGNRPELYVINAEGVFGEGRSFQLRIDGFVQKGKTQFRIFADAHKADYSIDELAERLVRAAVKLDLNEVVPA